MIIAQCPVCKDTLSRGCDIVMAPCGHTYHEFCLSEWLKTKPSCPQCRKQAPRTRVKKLFFDYVEDPTFTSDEPEAKVARLQAELEARDSKVVLCEALVSNLQTSCNALEAKVARAKAALDEEKELRRKERSEKDRVRTELFHTSELLKQALVDKKELDALRAKINLLKDTENLLKASSAEVASITAVYEDQAAQDSPQSAVRHLSCLLAVLKRELEAVKANKRALRRERHALMKEVAALRRKMAGEADAVRQAEEELRQEKAYAASLERECDSLRERLAQGPRIAEPEPSGERRRSLAKAVRNSNVSNERSIANDSALDLFDSETPGQERLVIDSRYFDTPETPNSAAKPVKPPGINPFAVGRQSITTEEEDEAAAAPVKPKPLGPRLQNFNIMRSHLMAGKPNPQPPAVYDGLGSRQRCSSPVFGARRPPASGPFKRLGRLGGRRKVKKSAPAGPTLDSFVRRG